MSVDGLRQGDAPATVYFNILVVRVYKKQLATLDGRGVLFAVVDDFRVLGPPEVIGEIVEAFPKVAWEEARLTTRTAKNKIFVQPSARSGWRMFLEFTPPKSFPLPTSTLHSGRQHLTSRLGPGQLPHLARG